MSETFEGVVAVHWTTPRGRKELALARKNRWRNGVWLRVPILAVVDTGLPAPWKHSFFLRCLPRHAAFADLLKHDGCRVRVTCTPRRYSNGLGADALRATVECLQPDEHTLAALASLGGEQ